MAAWLDGLPGLFSGAGMAAGAPDGRGAVVISSLGSGGPLPARSKTTMLWLTPDPWRVVARHRLPLYARAPTWSPDGAWLALEGDGIEVFDTRTKKRHAFRAGGRGPLCWTSDSQTLIGVVSDVGLFSWTPATGAWRVLPWPEGTDFLNYGKALRIGPDGRILAIGSRGGYGENQTVLFDLTTGAVASVRSETLAVFWWADGQECALLGAPPTLQLLVGAPSEPVLLPRLFGNVHLSPSGERLLLTGDSSVAMVDLTDASVLSLPEAEFVCPNAAAWVGEAAVVVVDDTGDVCLIDAESGAVLLELFGEMDALIAGILPDGRTFVWPDYRLVVVDEGGAVRAVAIDPESPPTGQIGVQWGEHLVLSGEGGALIVCDLAQEREVTRLIGHTGALMYARFSADGAWLASASWDGSLRIWSTADWTEQACFVSTDWVGSMTGVPGGSWAPGGGRLAVTTTDKTPFGIRIWQASGVVIMLPGEAVLGWLDDAQILIRDQDAAAVWCVETGARLAACPIADVCAVKQWVMGAQIAVVDRSARLLLWTPGDGLRVLESAAKVCDAAWSAGGALLSRDEAGALCCWTDGTLRWQRAGIAAVAVHPEQDTALVVADGRVEVLAVDSGQPTHTLAVDNVASVHWMGGRVVLGGSAGGVGGAMIRVWEPVSGRVRALWGSSGRLFFRDGEGPVRHDGEAPLFRVEWDGEVERLVPADRLPD